MNIRTSVIIALLLVNFYSRAQERSAFRSGYIRLGINQLGDDLENNLSPKQNVFKGNYGASSGFVFETGRIFYFVKAETKQVVNFGLDWTYISLNYNKMDKWDSYDKAALGSPVYSVDGTKIAAAISSKLGPVISFNPIEKLVFDVRAQIAPTVRFFDLSYAEESGNTTTRYFSFTNDLAENMNESFNAESIKNRIAFGFQKSFGFTVRRKAIGVSLDFVSGKVKSNYEAKDNSVSSNGKEKIPVNNFQVKINLTL